MRGVQRGRSCETHARKMEEERLCTSTASRRALMSLVRATAIIVSANAASDSAAAVPAPPTATSGSCVTHYPTRLAFAHSPVSPLSNLQRHSQSRRRASGSADAIQAERSGAKDEQEPRPAGPSDIADDSWYLGDGGFAERHLEDADHIAAKKTEKQFFRERSLSVYNQMKEASMLLLAQQQILAAEEAREESTKPRFVAAAGGSQAARAQAMRDRRDRRQAVAVLLPPEPKAPSPDVASEIKSGGSRTGAMAVPTGPGMLSGAVLGVGGLDEELEEIRRRVCVPLAAPADLLEDLGISPVRGLLLHGPPGCGKTLLARRLSAALTRRPPAVVSGPEILERFVGSSEANIRALFDYPPDVPGGSDAEQVEALHVIVMDEFDSIGQRRGGGDDGGDRVRDSVVNQLLARMDGFQELDRPTLLVALTNRIDLLDTALLRPGRFEVQVQIPGPDQAGREAILRIHTQRMYQANRIDIPSSPPDTKPPSTASPSSDSDGRSRQDGYDSLVAALAATTNGFTGAELAGLVRAAASYALERAVSGGVDEGGGNSNALECRVTAIDFDRGLADVTRSKLTAARPLTVTGAESLDTQPSVLAEEGVREEGGVSVADEWAKLREAKARSSSAAPAASVAAVRAASELGGSLSSQDLEEVQKLIQQKTSQKEGEDDLLFDAAKVVAERRRGTDGGSGADEKAGKTDEGEQADSSIGEKKKPTVRKFEHTGWFHSYE